MGCDLCSRHRGGANLSPRWRASFTAVTPTRHRGGVRFSLCPAKIIKGSDLHNSKLRKYYDFTPLEGLTSAFLCCNFAVFLSC